VFENDIVFSMEEILDTLGNEKIYNFFHFIIP